MPKMRLNGLEEVSILIRQMAERGEDVAKAAVYAGAAVVADALKRQVEALPEEEGYMLNKQHRQVCTHAEKEALLSHMGIAHFDTTGGKVSTAIGFDGYAENIVTDAYPRGLPVPLLARSIESGSSVRHKLPFVRKAASSAKSVAQNAMEIAAYEEIEKIIGGK